MMHKYIYFTVTIYCFLANSTTIFAQQRDTLTYHFTNGDSVRSHNIGVLYKDNITLLNLAGKVYDIKELDYVFNPVSNEKMLLQGSGSAGSVKVYRRDAQGKFADLYSTETVKLATYPIRGTVNQTDLYFNNGSGLQKLNYKNTAPLLLKDPSGQPYYDQAKNLHGLGGVLIGIGAATAIYGIARSSSGEDVGGVIALFPLSLFGTIAINSRKKKVLSEGFKVVNGIE